MRNLTCVCAVLAAGLTAACVVASCGSDDSAGNAAGAGGQGGTSTSSGGAGGSTAGSGGATAGSTAGSGGATAGSAGAAGSGGGSGVDGGSNADAGSPEGGEAGTQPAVLRVSKNLVSLKVGQVIKVNVDAFDTFGVRTTFLPKTTGNCATVSFDGTSITLTGAKTECTQDISIEANNSLTKKLTVNGYDPLVMDIGDGLLISYVNAYTWKWNDSGSGGSMDGTFWHPAADNANGWYAVGSYVQANYQDINASKGVPSIVAKDTSALHDQLAAPTGYTLIWDDTGSGASADGSIWHATCPVGFVALGDVVNAGHGAPPTDAVRCIKANKTIAATIGSPVFNDGGSGSNGDIATYLIGPPSLGNSPDGRAALGVGSIIGCPSYADPATVCDFKFANLLLVPMPIAENSDDGNVEPKLSGATPLDVSFPRYFSKVRLPFTLIPSENPACGSTTCSSAGSRVDANVHTQPFYYLLRQEVYTHVNGLDNRQGTFNAPLGYVVTNTFSQTDATKFSQEIGLTITVSGSATFLGAGSKYSVELSTKLGWEQSRAQTYGMTTESSFSFMVPPGKYAELIQVLTQFRAVSEQGFVPGTAPLVAGQNTIKYLQYPLP